MNLLVHCPAKLNLFLAVGPRDRRGYHPLRTIFQAIGLCDLLDIALGVEKTTVEFEHLDIPANNTVTKALRLISEFTELPPMKIIIRKFIPTMSGMGGGSSNAAGLIRAVRYLYPERFSATDAHTVATAVGADVPFFLVGGQAKGEGYGEILTPLPDAPKDVWALVVMPPYAFSTPEMFTKLDALEYEFLDFPEDDRHHNDFEKTLWFGEDLMQRLRAFGGKRVGMTGSGSAMYGLFESEKEAKQAASFVGSEDLGRTWVVPFLTREESLSLQEMPA